MSPAFIEGYAAGWRTNIPSSTDGEYRRGFEEAVAFRHRRDGLYVSPSTRKTSVKPKAHQKISYSRRRPAPPEARRGYKPPTPVASSTS